MKLQSVATLLYFIIQISLKGGKSANLINRLENGEVIIGDGSYVVSLEKRCYVKAGRFTPEAACEHPEAVKQLGMEFARAGADVTQTFTYFTTEEKRPEGVTVSVS